jgi:hypothetical protein
MGIESSQARFEIILDIRHIALVGTNRLRLAFGFAEG